MRERGTCGTVTYHCATRPKTKQHFFPHIYHIRLPNTKALRTLQNSTGLRFAEYASLLPNDGSSLEETKSLHRPISPIPDPVTTSRCVRHGSIRIHLDRRFTCTSSRGSPTLTDLNERR
jgi:hypothetical protein